MSDWPEDEAPDWWQQQDNEARRAEEEAMAKSRCLLKDLRRETKEFETEMTESKERINTNWRDFHGNHG